HLVDRLWQLVVGLERAQGRPGLELWIRAGEGRPPGAGRGPGPHDPLARTRWLGVAIDDVRSGNHRMADLLRYAGAGQWNAAWLPGRLAGEPRWDLHVLVRPRGPALRG